MKVNNWVSERIFMNGHPPPQPPPHISFDLCQFKSVVLRSVNKCMRVMLFTTSAHAVKLRCVWEGPGLIWTSAIMLNNQPDQSAASNYTAVPITDTDSGKQICSGEWWGGKKKTFSFSFRNEICHLVLKEKGPEFWVKPCWSHSLTHTTVMKGRRRRFLIQFLIFSSHVQHKKKRSAKYRTPYLYNTF